MADMICGSCCEAADMANPELHDECPGETWCDCQHREGGVIAAHQTEPGQD